MVTYFVITIIEVIDEVGMVFQNEVSEELYGLGAKCAVRVLRDNHFAVGEGYRVVASEVLEEELSAVVFLDDSVNFVFVDSEVDFAVLVERDVHEAEVPLEVSTFWQRMI